MPDSIQPAARPSKKPGEAPQSVFLVPYPKIVFLYPLLLTSVVAAIWTRFFAHSEQAETTVGVLFLAVLAVNLVILAFDFPRATSLTLFFFGVAVVLGLVLLSTFQPEILSSLTRFLARFGPHANAHFYWGVAGILGLLFLAMMVVVRFDYWEVRPNELLHHHGFLSDLERLSAPNLRIEKEINDIFEYMLLRSGRLVLHAGSERRAIVLDNIPMIEQKEEAITRMLGALQVQVREDGRP
jgi:hypothetical protein